MHTGEERLRLRLDGTGEEATFRLARTTPVTLRGVATYQGDDLRAGNVVEVEAERGVIQRIDIRSDVQATASCTAKSGDGRETCSVDCPVGQKAVCSQSQFSAICSCQNA
jgi:hypothetical protein